MYLWWLEQRWNVPTCGLQIDMHSRPMKPSNLLKLRDDLVALDRVQDIEGDKKRWDRVWNGREVNHLICALRTKERVPGVRRFGSANYVRADNRSVLDGVS